MTDTAPTPEQLSGAAPDGQMEGMSREWNYHPDLPLQDPSVFQWPPNPAYLLGWLARNWLTLSERVIMALVAVALWFFFYPSLEQAQSFAFGWIAQIWVVNFAMICLFAGSLHWFFYIRQGQGKKLKFDHRPQGKNNKLWNFSNQVHDNMFWSLGSGVLQLTGFQAVTMWLMANGYTPTITFAENPVWFLAFLVIIPMWSAFHFYWAHRLLHQPFLYRRVHSLHHRNVNIGPWSGFSMHPVEHFLYLSTLCIHWIVPSHPIHLYFHIVFQGPGAAMSHTGYEDL
ncbi:MAG: sterol desaturase family protein, partial [Rhodobacteraceae bacterium]|nr:sterol desaturase family protein [Paracoccaceae bacterium]